MMWIVVPAKAPDLAKSRLSPMLTRKQRADLARDLFGRTLHIAKAAAPEAQIVCVSNSEELRAAAWAAQAFGISDTGCGLNEALRLADCQIPQSDEMLVLPADLPMLEVEDVHALLHSPSECAIAPNRARDGTNALLYRRGPRLFRFGHGSFAAHLREQREDGGAWGIIERPGLAFDLDLPSEFCELLTKTGHWAKRDYTPIPTVSVRNAPA